MTQDNIRLNRILEVLLDVAVKVSGADMGSVMVTDPQTQELTIRAARGIADDIVRKTHVRLGSGVSGVAVQEGRAFLIDEHSREDKLRPFLNRNYISSSIVIPFKICESLEGVINLGILGSSSTPFTKETIDLVAKLTELATLST